MSVLQAHDIMQKHDNRLNRGTPRTQAGRTLEMRLRLQQAAYEVVAGGGLAALRIASVAKTAGVSQGAVLHHFPNKEALTFGALEQALILANSESSVWRLDAADPAQLLQGMVDEFRGFFFSDRFWVAIGITIEYSKVQGVADRLATEVARLRQPVYQTWSERLAGAGFPGHDAEKLVRSCAALLSGIAVRRLWAPPDAIADELVSDWLASALALLERANL